MNYVSFLLRLWNGDLKTRHQKFLPYSAGLYLICLVITLVGVRLHFNRFLLFLFTAWASMELLMSLGYFSMGLMLYRFIDIDFHPADFLHAMLLSFSIFIFMGPLMLLARVIPGSWIWFFLILVFFAGIRGVLIIRLFACFANRSIWEIVKFYAFTSSFTVLLIFGHFFLFVFLSIMVFIG